MIENNYGPKCPRCGEKDTRRTFFGPEGDGRNLERTCENCGKHFVESPHHFADDFDSIKEHQREQELSLPIVGYEIKWNDGLDSTEVVKGPVVQVSGGNVQHKLVRKQDAVEQWLNAWQCFSRILNDLEKDRTDIETAKKIVSDKIEPE